VHGVNLGPGRVLHADVYAHDVLGNIALAPKQPSCRLHILFADWHLFSSRAPPYKLHTSWGQPAATCQMLESMRLSAGGDAGVHRQRQHPAGRRAASPWAAARAGATPYRTAASCGRAPKSARPRRSRRRWACAPARRGGPPSLPLGAAPPPWGRKAGAQLARGRRARGGRGRGRRGRARENAPLGRHGARLPPWEWPPAPPFPAFWILGGPAGYNRSRRRYSRVKAGTPSGMGS